MTHTITSTYISGITLTSGDNPTTIASTGSVGATLSNSPAILGPAGTAWAVTNLGTVASSGANAFGIYLASGGTVVNAACVTLSSTVAGGFAVYLMGAGGVTNLSTGTIAAAGGGAIDISGVGSIANYGTLNGVSDVVLGLALLTVANTGVILGVGSSSTAAQLTGGGYLTNSGTGTIIAASGVSIPDAVGTVINSGTIEGTASRAIYLHAGTVVNSGVLLASGTGAGSLNRGIYIYGNGDVTNLSGGTITGNAGVFFSGGYADTLNNSGTIIGIGSLAVSFNGGGTHRVIDNPGAVFTGGVYGGTVASATMELASGSSAGTLSGFGTTITNFNTLAFDSGADWTVAGNTSTIGLGTLDITGFAAGDTIDLTGFIAVSDSFGTNVATFTSAGSISETLHLLGSFSSANLQFASDGASGTDVFVGTAVSNLIYGQTIDVPGTIVASETVTAGILTLRNGTGASLGTIAVGTSLSTGDFTLRPDTSSGTNVIVSTVFGTYASGVTLLTNPTTIASSAQVRNTATSASAVYGPSGTAWTVINEGIVTEIGGNSYGILIRGAGAVTNVAGGTISATSFDAVAFSGGAGTIVNSGNIQGGKFAVYEKNGGSVTNLVGGIVTGAGGVRLNSPGTVINAGTIIGTNPSYGAVRFNATGAPNRLIVDPGAVFSGQVSGVQTGTNVIELASAVSAGTLSGFGTSITNFSSLVFDAGSNWTVTGNNAFNGLGTIEIAGFAAGDTIDLTGFSAVNRVLSSGTLVLSNNVGGSDTLFVQGTLSTASVHLASDSKGGTLITVQTGVPPAIAGTKAGLTGSDVGTVLPFSTVTITDSNAGSQTEAVTVTLAGGDANGTLSGAGLTETGVGTGIYTLTAGTPVAVTAALDAAVFTPTAHQVIPGSTVTSHFAIGVTDTAAQTASDTVTTVIVTAFNDPPVIAGTMSGQSATDETTATPLSTVTISDVDFGQDETVTVTLSAAANGTLASGKIGSYDSKLGVYTVIGTDAFVTAAIDALVFTPTIHQVPPGTIISTVFTLKATDLAGGSSTNDTASVFVTAANDPPAELTLFPASDSGVPGDDITNVPLPTITGSAPANSIIDLYDGGILIGTGTANGLGAWSVTATTALIGGSNTLTATATDVALDVSLHSSALVVTLDTAIPAAPVPILAPASDSGIPADDITNVTLPIFTGTAPANSIVRLYDGATLIGIATANGAGAWSILAISALTEGVNSITSTATDVAGNVSLPSIALVVTRVTAIPAAPVPSLSPASDSGVPADDITHATLPTFTGTAPPNSIVRLYDGATLIAIGGADGTGAWSIPAATALAEGANNITGTATDVAGNVSLHSAILTVTIDTTIPLAPSVAILSPGSDSGIPGDDITHVTLPTFTGTAPANSFVRLYDGATLIGTGTADGLGAWSILVTTALAEGLNTITSTATDVAGNVSLPSTALVVTLVTALPAAPVPILSPASDSGIPADDITNVTLPAFTGTAPANSIVRLYDGATLIGTGTADGLGAWSILVTTALADGVNSITSTATDVAGNVSLPSTALVVTLETACPPPETLLLAEVSDSGVTGDDITNVALPTFTGTARAGAIVNLYDGAVLIGTGTADGRGAWSITATTALAEGANTITGTATDVAGNVSPHSEALTVTIDTEIPLAPSVAILSPASDSGTPGDDITNVALPTFTGTAPANSIIRLYDGATLVGTGVADGTGAWSVTVTTALAGGANSIASTATDLVGNVSLPSATLVVTLVTGIPALATPILSPASDSGTPGDDITNVPLPTFIGTAPPDSVIDLYDGGILIGTGTANGLGAWSITATTALIGGSHTLTATATDVALDVLLRSSALVVTLDTAIPAAPTPLLAPASDSGTPGDDITNVTLPTFTGTAPANSIVRLYNGATLIGTGVADGSGAWSVTVTIALAGGANSITGTATDVAGNVSLPSAALVVTLVTASLAAPAALVLAAASDSGVKGDDITNLPLPTITGTGPENSAIDLYDGGILIGTGTADGRGAWSVTATIALRVGSNTLTATAMDAAMDVSLHSAALVVTLDTAIPSAPVPILSPASDSGIPADDITNVTLPIFTGIAPANSSVNLYDGSRLIGTGATDGTGAWSILATSALTAGVNSIASTATDVAGNVSLRSAALTVTLDTIAPNVTESVEANPLDDDPPGRLFAPLLTGGGDPNAGVTITDGGAIIGTTQANAAGAWSFDLSGLSPGDHRLGASETDVAGNIGRSAPVALTIPPPAAPDTRFTLATGTAATSGSFFGSDYVGPEGGLQAQYGYTGTANVSVVAHIPDVFIYGGSGSDLLVPDGGSNVLDGGGGSNWMVGGTGADGGTDTFFADNRSNATTWDTILNFHPGDVLTVWDFNSDLGTTTWRDGLGAAGYTGATLQANLGNGTGGQDLITFSGLSAADATFTTSTGVSGGLSYLEVTRVA